MASVWGELKRRNVVKVAVAYAIVGWLLIEVSSVIAPALNLPNWAISLVVFFVILGFPLALILSWAYELTPEGMKRSHEVEATESITHVTGRKIDFAIIGVLAIAVAFFAVDRFVLVEEAPSPASSTTDRRSVAALPFSNESAAEENAEFFANGVHDNLLTQLAKISALKVISRTSVMEYRDTTKNMREIGRELGVATILEGGVQRAGDAVQINVQLIDAETDEHLWAETYNRQLTAENIFAIQAEMATAIAEALQATILPQELSRLTEVPTQSTRAWEFYVSGQDYSNQPDELTFMPLAIQQYERALEEDPEFALAWAALSAAHSEMYWSGIDPTESRLQRANDAVESALELAPESPEAHWAMANYHYFGFRDYDSALKELAIAEQGMSGLSEVFFLQAGVYRAAGRWQEALAIRDRALELDPRNVDQLVQQSVSYSMLRDYMQSERFLDRALEIEPDNAVTHRYKAYIALLRDGDVSLLKAAAENSPIDLGRFRAEMGWTAALYERNYDAALAYLDGWEVEVFRWEVFYTPKALYYGVTYRLAGLPDQAEPQFQAAREQLEEELAATPSSASLLTSLGVALAGLGEHEEAVSTADRAIGLIPTSEDALLGPLIQIEAIKVLIAAQDHDAAIDELDAYFDGPGWWSIEGLFPDPRLDPLRDDPRFQTLLEKYSRR